MSIKIEGLRKNYDKLIALKSISLEIKEGKIYGLLGPNGSGKTTLIKILNGLLQPSGGKVTVDDEPIGVNSKKMISYLPEKSYFDSSKKVEEYIQLFSDFYTDFDKEKCKHILEVFNINPQRKINTLSKGNKEKVQVALVMSRHVKYYILDEPIAGVDPASREFILNTIIKNQENDSTIIISTHLISDVEKYLTDVIFINYGNILVNETKGSLEERYNESVDQVFREVFRCSSNY